MRHMIRWLLGAKRGVRKTRRGGIGVLIWGGVLAVVMGCGGSAWAQAAATEGEARGPGDPKLHPAVHSNFPWEEEVLYYSIRFNGVEAMRAQVQVGEVKKKGKLDYVAVQGTVQSVGLFSTIYPVDDRANSYFNPYSAQVYWSDKHFAEAGKERTYKVVYHPLDYVSKVKQTYRGETYRFIRDIPSHTHDMFTWFFELRRRYPLEIGEEVRTYVYDGWKLSDFRGIVRAKEDLLTDMGWFKTYRIEFLRDVMSSELNPEGGEPLLDIIEKESHRIDVWVSRDANMLPVKIAMRTPWGSGDLVLIRYVVPKNFYRRVLVGRAD